MEVWKVEEPDNFDGRLTNLEGCSPLQPWKPIGTPAIDPRLAPTIQGYDRQGGAEGPDALQIKIVHELESAPLSVSGISKAQGRTGKDPTASLTISGAEPPVAPTD